MLKQNLMYHFIFVSAYTILIMQELSLNMSSPMMRNCDHILRLTSPLRLWNTRCQNFVMGTHAWNGTTMFLSRNKSSHEKIEGPPNDRGRNWDVKYGDTSNRILYRKISSPQLKFQDQTPGHGQGLTRKNK
jgi:hypothetical protein